MSLFLNFSQAALRLPQTSCFSTVAQSRTRYAERSGQTRGGGDAMRNLLKAAGVNVYEGLFI
eukprot:9132262-Pyramimonas_sp.AAC.1